MKIAIAADHAGFLLKEKLRAHLAQEGFSVTDLGTVSTDAVDYPEYARKVAHEVAGGRAELGVLVCGSGVGVSIVANKVIGIRAANVSSVDEARLSREHNNANVVAVGARLVDDATATQIVDTFLNTSFESGGRHERRVNQIATIEKEEAESVCK
jgi:ribose 5-phosphate isomerase B